MINWTEIVNVATKHETEMAQEQAREAQRRAQIERQVQVIVEKTIESIPYNLRLHLKTDGKKWMRIYAYNNGSEHQVQKEAMDQINQYLTAHNIVTRSDTGGNGHTTDYELYVDAQSLIQQATSQTTEPK